MTALLRRFVADRSGATAIEYVLVAALVSLSIVLWAGTIGNKLNNQFTDISTKFKS